jgi:1-aminocyclopropane-1-carboxylate deaminase/D-cysteine desulfhydrase-like pyridoxal-dependent ACC family enzyme
VPEGGTNIHAVKGCAELLDDLVSMPFDYIATACGTGGTLAGVICGLDGQKQVLGIPVLKGASFLYEEVGQLCEQYAGKHYKNWSLLLDFHHGGYAKSTPELLAFIDDFQRRHNIPIEPVYTGKLFFALYALIEAGHFPENSTIIALHTGGLRPT